MLTRIKKYIDYKGISISAFEKSIGMSNASFGKSLKSGGSIGGDKLEKILKIYPDINPEWLLTGIGSMLRTNNLAHEQVAPDTSTMHLIMQRYEALVAENALLKRENEELKLSRGKSTYTPSYPISSEKIGTHTAAEPTHK